MLFVPLIRLLKANVLDMTLKRIFLALTKKQLFCVIETCKKIKFAANFLFTFHRNHLNLFNFKLFLTREFQHDSHEVVTV